MRITVEISDPISVSVRQDSGRNYCLVVANEAGEEADIAFRGSEARIGVLLQTALSCLAKALKSGDSPFIRLDEDSDAVGAVDTAIVL